MWNGVWKIILPCEPTSPDHPSDSPCYFRWRLRCTGTSTKDTVARKKARWKRGRTNTTNRRQAVWECETNESNMLIRWNSLHWQKLAYDQKMLLVWDPKEHQFRNILEKHIICVSELLKMSDLMWCFYFLKMKASCFVRRETTSSARFVVAERQHDAKECFPLM